MRYLIKARVRPGMEAELLRAIEDGTLGAGSVAGDEYLRNMTQARLLDGATRWIEVCFCETPLEEERPYWERYFEFEQIKNAHAPERCRDLNGTEPWACCDCDCTEKLEREMEGWGEKFLEVLRTRVRELENGCF